MDASVESEVMDPVNPAVLVLQRRASTQTLVGLYNMTPDVQKLPRWVVSLGNWSRDALTDETPLTDGRDRAAAVPGPLAGPVGVTSSGLGEGRSGRRRRSGRR